jgi:alpha/beta superfamily hydrolase
VTEEYRYLCVGGERVFAALHNPSPPSTKAVVMCNPLGEEKLWAHRVFVSLARALSSAGIAALRFDYRGEGDSDREFEQTDLETRVIDTSLSIDALREAHPSVSDITLLGLRFGTCVAATAAARRSDVARLILCDPVLDGAAHMQSVLRLNLTYQMALNGRVVENREALAKRLAEGGTVNIEGYELAPSLYVQTSAFRLQDALRNFEGETVLMQLTQSESPINEELTLIAAANERCRVAAVTEEPFWRETKNFCQRSEALTNVTLSALGAAR